ncbi:hypothetical protein EV126DRAFT_413613 [Verticillium dahliae]|nr:hypothetical protein EV126DRAFT_413613 [Verticillium dahliae]
MVVTCRALVGGNVPCLFLYSFWLSARSLDDTRLAFGLTSRSAAGCRTGNRSLRQWQQRPETNQQLLFLRFDDDSGQGVS